MGKTNWKYDPSVGEITYPLRVSEKTPFYRYGEEVPSYPDILMYVYLDELPSLIRHEQVDTCTLSQASAKRHPRP